MSANVEVWELIPERNESGRDGRRIAAVIHSFIVKIWVEPESRHCGGFRWHGHITHVSTNEKKYLKGWNDVGRFVRLRIAHEMPSTGVVRRIKQWLKR
jgi:hypothetical protein